MAHWIDIRQGWLQKCTPKPMGLKETFSIVEKMNTSQDYSFLGADDCFMASVPHQK